MYMRRQLAFCFAPAAPCRASLMGVTAPVGDPCQRWLGVPPPTRIGQCPCRGHCLCPSGGFVARSRALHSFASPLAGHEADTHIHLAQVLPVLLGRTARIECLTSNCCLPRVLQANLAMRLVQLPWFPSTLCSHPQETAKDACQRWLVAVQRAQVMHHCIAGRCRPASMAPSEQKPTASIPSTAAGERLCRHRQGLRSLSEACLVKVDLLAWVRVLHVASFVSAHPGQARCTH